MNSFSSALQVANCKKEEEEGGREKFLTTFFLAFVFKPWLGFLAQNQVIHTPEALFVVPLGSSGFFKVS